MASTLPRPTIATVSQPDSGPGTLVVVAMETLWPANHGGRVDRWNRWLMMKRLGWRLVFVGWSADSSHEAADHRAAMAEIFDDTFYFANRPTVRSLARRLMSLPRHSPHMSARHVSGDARLALVAALRAHHPDAVVMDGLYGSDLGIALADDLEVPLFYRSHNIEHLYMRRQRHAARGWKRKAAMALASLHLERAEQRVMTAADQVFDISVDDIAFWQARGIERLAWLPPLIAAAPATAVPAPWGDRPYDAVYLGNLNTPNNVEGLAWFVERVLPVLRRERPGITVLIAGSRPSREVEAMAAGDPALTLMPNPDDVAATRALGRVMINPVLQGSGVNLKSVEMLFTDSPVVTTAIGVQGLDVATRDAFVIADTPEVFARGVLDALAAGPRVDSRRAAVRDRFGIKGAESFSAQLSALLAKGAR